MRFASQNLVQLLVVAHGQLQMARVDARLLVVTSGVAGQLEDLGGQVLEHSGQVDWSASANTLGVMS